MWREALELPRLDEVGTAGAISACEKGQKRRCDGPWQHALLLLKEFKELQVADAVSYNATISACETLAWEDSGHRTEESVALADHLDFVGRDVEEEHLQCLKLLGFGARKQLNIFKV